MVREYWRMFSFFSGNAKTTCMYTSNYQFLFLFSKLITAALCMFTSWSRALAGLIFLPLHKHYDTQGHISLAFLPRNKDIFIIISSHPKCWMQAVHKQTGEIMLVILGVILLRQSVRIAHRVRGHHPASHQSTHNLSDEPKLCSRACASITRVIFSHSETKQSVWKWLNMSHQYVS